MATLRALATPTVQIDNQTIAIVPNSLSYNGGGGETKVRPQIAGGGSITNVITTDAETKMSMVKFELATETGNIELKDRVLDKSQNRNGVSIRFSDQGFTKAFRNMRLLADPEIEIGVEGTFEMELMGDPTG